MNLSLFACFLGIILCIIHTESKNQCKWRWRGGCKQGGRKKIKQLTQVTRSECNAACIRTLKCRAYDHPAGVPQEKGTCNLFKKGCRKVRNPRKAFYGCSVKAKLPETYEINPKGCGKAGEKSPRVIGGEPAKLGQFPWQVVIFRKVKKGGKKTVTVRCGGSLLNERFVLTAAHCFKVGTRKLSLNPNDYFVRMGKVDLLKTEPNQIRRGIWNIILHEDYDVNSVGRTTNEYNNDIALLELKGPKVYEGSQHNTDVKPICIRKKKIVFGTDDNDCFVSGFGHTEKDYKTQKSLLPTLLMFAKLPLVDFNVCNAAFKKNFRFNSLTTNQLCAGKSSGDKDACQGDSGGPLSCKVKVTIYIPFETEVDTWYQAGVVSFGKGCGAKQSYGQYTVVANYVDWITASMNK